MVGGGGKMAELMLLSEIADPTRFFTDNLLSPEDWGVQREARGAGGGLWPAVGPAARGEAAEGGRRAHGLGERAAGPVLAREAGGGQILSPRGSTGPPRAGGEGPDSLG